MKRNRILRALRIALIAVVAVAVLSFVVMSLWNLLMPAIFGWHTVSFWQALGILILSRILFGGFQRRGVGGWHWRRRMAERWEQMTPEEREKFREGMRGRCGHMEMPATEQKV
ncbi:MAG TPA: hypothetical protein VKV15_14750 [Bryobacteraceae bacterium]|nr:hypothetical protein [Bryobacteraceae bacterium]